MLKYFPFQLNSANPAMRNKIPLRKLHVKVRCFFVKHGISKLSDKISHEFSFEDP